jgi:hypothetical protein
LRRVPTYGQLRKASRQHPEATWVDEQGRMFMDARIIQPGAAAAIIEDAAMAADESFFWILLPIQRNLAATDTKLDFPHVGDVLHWTSSSAAFTTQSVTVCNISSGTAGSRRATGFVTLRPATT